MEKVRYFRVSSKSHLQSERNTSCYFAVWANWKLGAESHVPLLTGTAVWYCYCLHLTYRCSRLVTGNETGFKVTFISFSNTLCGFCCYGSNGSLHKGHFAFASIWQKVSNVMLLSEVSSPNLSMCPVCTQRPPNPTLRTVSLAQLLSSEAYVHHVNSVTNCWWKLKEKSF
jgi:hypothetical protein